MLATYPQVTSGDWVADASGTDSIKINRPGYNVRIRPSTYVLNEFLTADRSCTKK